MHFRGKKKVPNSQFQIQLMNLFFLFCTYQQRSRFIPLVWKANGKSAFSFSTWKQLLQCFLPLFFIIYLQRTFQITCIESENKHITLELIFIPTIGCYRSGHNTKAIQETQHCCSIGGASGVSAFPPESILMPSHIILMPSDINQDHLLPQTAVPPVQWLLNVETQSVHSLSQPTCFRHPSVKEQKTGIMS